MSLWLPLGFGKRTLNLPAQWRMKHYEPIIAISIERLALPSPLLSPSGSTHVPVDPSLPYFAAYGSNEA